MSELLVEGTLDSILLQAVLQGKPPVRSGGSKNALPPKVKEERSRNPLSSASYIRDRDFDLDPPGDRSRPQVHQLDSRGRPLGWYWCRHEMENYLLEPGIVARALSTDQALYCGALREAAHRVRDYQAARAALGYVRRSLPPNHELQTRPIELKDDALVLPQDLSLQSLSTWACEQAGSFRARVCPQLEATSITQEVERRRGLLSDAILQSPEEILIWFSGKDLLAGLAQASWFAGLGVLNAGELRARLRDWVRGNPEEALRLLPEWQGFASMLNAD